MQTPSFLHFCPFASSPALVRVLACFDYFCVFIVSGWCRQELFFLLNLFHAILEMLQYLDLLFSTYASPKDLETSNESFFPRRKRDNLSRFRVLATFWRWQVRHF
jgi:hypothetical protein